MESEAHLGDYSGIKDNIDDGTIRERTRNEHTDNSPWNLIKGLKYRKIMRRTDMLKILFVCVCVCHVCPAHPCGDNPMRLIENYARARGVPSEQLLNVMQISHRSDYTLFMREYRKYLDCTQMVQNGYFKRSVEPPSNRRRMPARFPEATWKTNRRQLLSQIVDEMLTHRQEVGRRAPDMTVPRWLSASTVDSDRQVPGSYRTVPTLFKRIRKYISAYDDPDYEIQDAHALPVFSDVTDDVRR